MSIISGHSPQDVASIGLSSITYSNHGSIIQDDRQDPASSGQSSPLYGRDDEIKALRGAYERMRQNGTKDTVVVHGVSGSGKTSLVDTLRELVDSTQGCLCVGKFFQNDWVEPYSAIMAAFSDLCDLISQSEDFEQRRSDISKALGEDGRILANVVTSLSQFLDPATEPSDLMPQAAFTMFKVACKTFLSSMASSLHPVVLVLDDIQWMDEGSHSLIECLLDDTELKNLLLILVYRDEEADRVEQLFVQGTQLVDIKLSNLGVEEVHKIITPLLGIPQSDKTDALSQLILTRTEGNPLHVNMFLEFLEQEGLMTYDHETAKWDYVVETIRRETMLSDTLADVLTKKIQRLPLSVQDVLRVASLIGFHFSLIILSTVIEVVGLPEGEAQDVGVLLEQAIAARFIEQTMTGYQFGHDKLQSSFQVMIDEAELPRLHSIIGAAYVRQGDPESKYFAAIHLNRAIELLETYEHHIALARVNLEAATFCRDKSAFMEAEELLRFALGLIPEDERWTTRYDLTLEIVGSLAKMEMVIGNFDACREMNDMVILHARSADEKLEVLITSVEVAIAENRRVSDCEIAVNRALRVLGIILPAKLNLLHIVTKLLKVKFLLRRKTDEYILGMPVMSDMSKNTAMRLLVYGTIFGLINDNENHSVYCALLTVELTLKFGLSRYSSSAFAMYSMAELVMGNLDRAYRFGNLAKTMADNLDCKQSGSAAALLVNNMVSHWRESLHQLAGPTQRAMNASLEAGDYTFGIFGAAIVFGFRTCIGENLEELEESLRFIHSRCKNFKHDGSMRFFEPNFQFILNLRSHGESWQSLTEISGEIMSEGDYIRNAIDSNREVLLTLLWILKIQLTYLFGYYRQGESVLNDMEAFRKILRYGFNYSRWRLFGSLTFYERYRETSKGKHLRRARRYKRSFYSQDLLACPNSSPLLKLLIAEDESVKRRKDTVGTLALYDEAIQVLGDAKLVHLEAVANEKAAHFLCAEDNKMAEQYVERALEIYRYSWGATAKYEHLQQTSDRFLSKLTSSEEPTGPCSVIQVDDGHLQ